MADEDDAGRLAIAYYSTARAGHAQRLAFKARELALRDAAAVAEGYATFARGRSIRHPAEWTTAAETAEIIGQSIIALIPQDHGLQGGGG
jgi:hypothetical protein